MGVQACAEHGSISQQGSRRQWCAGPVCGLWPLSVCALAWQVEQLGAEKAALQREKTELQKQVCVWEVGAAAHAVRGKQSSQPS